MIFSSTEKRKHHIHLLSILKEKQERNVIDHCVLGLNLNIADLQLSLQTDYYDGAAGKKAKTQKRHLFYSDCSSDKGLNRYIKEFFLTLPFYKVLPKADYKKKKKNLFIFKKAKNFKNPTINSWN